MKDKRIRQKIIQELLDKTDEEFTDEELIRQLTMTEITENSDRTEKPTLGQRASDAVARTRRKLGVYCQLYRRDGRLDGAQHRHGG